VARAVSIGPIVVADAGGGTGLHWAAWSNQAGPSPSVRLALFDTRKSPAEAVWSQSWPGAYDPRFVALTPWVSARHPVYALTMQFGAAAEQVDLFGLDSAGRPARLAEKLGAEIGFIVAADQSALVVYQTPHVALVPSCYEWSDRGKLVASACPRP
jgi:hypothetical protein